MTLTLTGFNSESIYFFTFSRKLLRESNVLFFSSRYKEGSIGLEFIVLSEKIRHTKTCIYFVLNFLEREWI